MQWLETPGNDDKYRSAPQDKDDGRKRTSASTKVDVSRRIVEHLAKAGVVMTDKQVNTKIHNLVSIWKDAHLAMAGTGFGVDGKGQKDGKTLRGKFAPAR